jgi:hypothetical protein
MPAIASVDCSPELKPGPADTVAPPVRAADLDEAPTRASCLASTLSAGLELVRRALEARQLAAFEDVYLRRREAAG